MRYSTAATTTTFVCTTATKATAITVDTTATIANASGVTGAVVGIDTAIMSQPTGHWYQYFPFQLLLHPLLTALMQA
jgi:hypothetical protein